MKIEAGMYSRMEHFILLVARNIRGNDRLFIHSSHDAHPFMEGVYEGGESEEVIIHFHLGSNRFHGH